MVQVNSETNIFFAIYVFCHKERDVIKKKQIKSDERSHEKRECIRKVSQIKNIIFWERETRISPGDQYRSPL